MRYKTILLFGAPGSGKGTQGKILGAIPGFYHSACGDVFRTLDLQSEMGRVFWQYSSRGELVPDEFTVKLWKNYIQGMEMINQFHPETSFLVLDGMLDVVVDGAVVAQVGPGAVLGERSILDGGRRTATLLARTKVTVAVAPRDAVDLERLALLVPGHDRENA